MLNYSRKNRRGFTLAEMLIAIAIFGLLSGITGIMVTNLIRSQKKITLENAIYEDARFLLEKIVRLSRASTIDYEEYYNRKVVSKFEANATYGQNYGYYGTMFYNPGLNDGENVGDFVVPAQPVTRSYGAYYNDGTAATNLCEITMATRKLTLGTGGGNVCPPDTLTTKVPNVGFDVVVQDTVDYNDGRNPFAGGAVAGADYNKATAFCDDTKGGTVPACTGATDQIYQQDQLYLIDQYGQKKYIFAREKVRSAPDQFVLSFLEMDGEDANSNTISESWSCAEGYDCRPKIHEDVDNVDNDIDIYKDLVPISPLRANIVDLKFYVSPLEDPRKGYGESEPIAGPITQIQPHVTIVMTVEPSAEQLSGYPGPPPRITLQTTVSSRVYHEVKSYGP